MHWIRSKPLGNIKSKILLERLNNKSEVELELRFTDIGFEGFYDIYTKLADKKIDVSDGDMVYTIDTIKVSGNTKLVYEKNSHY